MNFPKFYSFGITKTADIIQIGEHSISLNPRHFKAEVIKLNNHLKNQTSPYLLQHAGNPVDWYPWCEEAFARAKKEDKPVFLSIGYSTCHWCHVMAHESFEDKEVAKELNENFISIKVDREERPDIDSIYMEACVLFTGSGGWPASIFSDPGAEAFLCGDIFSKIQRLWKDWISGFAAGGGETLEA